MSPRHLSRHEAKHEMKHVISTHKLTSMTMSVTQEVQQYDSMEEYDVMIVYYYSLWITTTS